MLGCGSAATISTTGFAAGAFDAIRGGLWLTIDFPLGRSAVCRGSAEGCGAATLGGDNSAVSTDDFQGCGATFCSTNRFSTGFAGSGLATATCPIACGAGGDN